MTNFDWGRFAEACEIAEQQWITNTPLPPAPVSNGLVAGLKAAQPFIDKAAAFVKTKPGSITAALTMLAELKRQGFVWAGEIEEIVNAAANALPTASADLAEAINVMSEFAPAPNPSGGMGVRVGRG